MKLLVLPNEKFTCHSCTRCCRDWHVELMPGERERISQLKWTQDDLAGGNAFLTHAGKTFLGHKKNGACLFLNEDNGRCRIHEKFGPQAKPLGCRLFPFQLAPGFAGEATVTARLDCPTVRKNEGAAHADSLAALRRQATELQISEDGFDELTRCLLDREQITGVTDFVSTLLPAFERDDQRAIFINLLCDRLHEMDVRELSRGALVTLFPQLKEQVEAATSSPAQKPAGIHRLSLRTLLALYLRRDEDVLNRRATRWSRTMATTAVIAGGGSLRGLGLSHPAGTLKKARLFAAARFEIETDAFSLHWRHINNRLASFQFMGQANHGRNFLDGLRSLALLYPLTLAAAKYHAGNRGSARVEKADVDFAVPAIEHSFGRLPILNEPLAKRLHVQLLETQTFIQLARTI